MNTNYAIAYANKDDKDFFGRPWINGDFGSLEECNTVAQDMIAEGYKNVVVFTAGNKKETGEDYSWEYVRKHKI